MIRRSLLVTLVYSVKRKRNLRMHEGGRRNIFSKATTHGVFFFFFSLNLSPRPIYSILQEASSAGFEHRPWRDSCPRSHKNNFEKNAKGFNAKYGTDFFFLYIYTFHTIIYNLTMSKLKRHVLNFRLRPPFVLSHPWARKLVQPRTNLLQNVPATTVGIQKASWFQSYNSRSIFLFFKLIPTAHLVNCKNRGRSYGGPWPPTSPNFYNFFYTRQNFKFL